MHFEPNVEVKTIKNEEKQNFRSKKNRIQTSKREHFPFTDFTKRTLKSLEQKKRSFSIDIGDKKKKKRPSNPFRLAQLLKRGLRIFIFRLF